MNTTTDLSVIIVTWNSQDWIQRCLRSVYAQTSDLKLEVIVVDNASTDKTVQYIMNEFHDVSVVQNRDNIGFSAAVNQGIRASTGRYMCWLNPDTEILDRALEQLVEIADRDTSIGIIAPQLHNEDGSTQASIRRFPKVSDQALIMLKLHALWPDAKSLSRYLARDFDYTRRQDAEQVMGACMLVRRELVDAIGPLDTKFFIWFEDVDFCFRTKRDTQYRIVYEPTAHVVHFGGDSFDKVPMGRKQRWYRQSLRHYMAKQKFWGATILLWLLTPLSFISGLFVALASRTKRGQNAVLQNKQRRKQT